MSLFNLVGHFLILWTFIRAVDNEPFVNFGFHIKNRLKDIGTGVFLGFLIMGIGLLLLLQLNEVCYLSTEYEVREILLSIGVFIIVAVVEEVLFRGYVLRNFMYSFNKYIALILSSVLFSLMHGANPKMDWFSFLNLFLVGILLGISYMYTKNLWFPIALHFSWNFFQTLFGFNVSGQDFYSLIEFKIFEDNLINGGAFGFEGSVLSIIAQVIVITSVVVYYTLKTKKYKQAMLSSN